MLNSIFYNLKDFVQRQFSLVSTPVESMSRESVRQRALVLGIPAVLIAAIGISALCWAKFGMASNLEKWYQTEAERSTRQKNRLTDELNTELRIHQASASESVDQQDIDELIPKDDPRRVELEQLQASEEVYWEKLISLNPAELEYRYQLALVTFMRGDTQRGFSLMQAIAPLSEPGFAKAHLWLSKYLMGMRSGSIEERKQILGMAYQHAELCLRRGQSKSEEGMNEWETAQLIKATLLYAQQKWFEAYEAYEKLFDRNPAIYERLVEINRTLDRNSFNKDVYARALSHFDSQFDDPDLSVENWVGAWNHVVTCLAGQSNYKSAESRLLAEIKRQSAVGVDGVVKRVFVEQLLSNLYLRWMRDASKDLTQISQQDLDFLKKAFQFNPNNPEVLRGLARVAVSDNEQLATAAREIYDPEKHPDPPASVLNELGSNSLARGNYEAAIRYFELARRKDPRNSSILNNLAYTYLVCEDKNPERSLKLVDEAIRFLPQDEQSKKVLSHFFDTRGNALMQLNRMTEAIAAFEIAIQERPWNRGILESLIKCYQGNDLVRVYEDRLKELDTREATGVDTEDSTPNNPTVN